MASVGLALSLAHLDGAGYAGMIGGALRISGAVTSPRTVLLAPRALDKALPDTLAPSGDTHSRT